MAGYFLLRCIVTSLACMWGTIWIWLWFCVCECRHFSFLCVSHAVRVCVHEGWVCVFLFTCVFLSCFCVFDVLSFKDASACACLYGTNVCVYLCLSDMCKYSSEHAFMSLLLTSTEGCAKVSLCCTFPLGVTHSYSSQAGDLQCLFLTCSLKQSSPKRNPGALDGALLIKKEKITRRWK